MVKSKAYPGCPSLSWMIAKRVTGGAMDATIGITGPKGRGKSTTSLALAEALAKDISYLRDKGEPPEKFFSIRNVVSVSPTGAFDLISGDSFGTIENSIYLIDDSGTQYAARRFAGQINQRINETLQIARIYKNVLIFNYINEGHIDLQGRQLTDVKIEVLLKNVPANQTILKVMLSETRGSTEYKKYFRWHGMRITRFICGRPSPELESQYIALRRRETDAFIHRDSTVPPVVKKPPRALEREKTLGRLVPEVVKIMNDAGIPEKDKSVYKLANACATNRYWAGEAVSEAKLKGLIS